MLENEIDTISIEDIREFMTEEKMLLSKREHLNELNNYLKNPTKINEKMFYPNRSMTLFDCKKQNSTFHPINNPKFLIARDIPTDDKSSPKRFTFFDTSIDYLKWSKELKLNERNDFEIIF